MLPLQVLKLFEHLKSVYLGYIIGGTLIKKVCKRRVRSLALEKRREKVAAEEAISKMKLILAILPLAAQGFMSALVGRNSLHHVRVTGRAHPQS